MVIYYSILHNSYIINNHTLDETQNIFKFIVLLQSFIKTTLNPFSIQFNWIFLNHSQVWQDIVVNTHV